MFNGIFKVRSNVIAGFMAIAFLYIAGPAQADQQSGRVDLLTEFNVQIVGDSTFDRAGFSVSGAGDVNGDGRPDVIVSAPFARIEWGSVYVIFGKVDNSALPSTLDLANIGEPGNEQGFRIDGFDEDSNSHSGYWHDFETRAGWSVSEAGDVNGDGLADVIVGAPGVDNNGPGESGSAFVVLGKSDNTDTVNLADVGTPGNREGFRIDGAGPINQAGISVSSAGDMNGDGLGDVIVGAHGASNNGRPSSGSAYVISGKSDNTDTVNLADVGTPGNREGFRIDGAETSDGVGTSVSEAGDVNRDGIPDVIVGAYRASSNGRHWSGSAYVVFGKDSADSVDLRDLGTPDGPDRDKGFRIDGAESDDRAGLSVSEAGDVNGDGSADVIVGAYFADNNDRDKSGSAYVVYGKSGNRDTVDLAGLVEGKGFRIDGATEGDEAGKSVSKAGDVNDDGRPDLIVGASHASNNSHTDSGSAYVILGKSEDFKTIDLAELGEGEGFRIDGASRNDYAGWSVSEADDVNGDGIADVIVGAHYAGPEYAGFGPGSAYIIYGTPQESSTDPGGRSGGSDIPKGTGTQTVSSQPESCAKVLYENTLEVPREARLADLVKGKGLKIRASASKESSGTLKVEMTGRQARHFKIYRKNSRVKSKKLAGKNVRIGIKPKAVYLVAKGRTRRLIERALKLKGAQKSTKLKVSLLTHSVAKKSLGRLNRQTVRAIRRGKVKRADTYTKIRQVVDRSLCSVPLVSKIKGPHRTKLTSLTTSKGKRGSGIKVRVSCSDDCTAKVGFRLWGRYEIGLKFRKVGGGNRLLSSRKVKLRGGETKTFELDGVVSKKLRKLLVSGAKKKRYKRVKVKYLIEARTADGRSTAASGTSRVPLKFR